MKQDNKKILIFDNALEQTMTLQLNRLDYYSYRNIKLPEVKTLKQIENKMFLDLKNVENINVQIKTIAKIKQCIKSTTEVAYRRTSPALV